MESIVIVGIGNILFRDEGVGCYAGRYLETNYDFSRPVEVIDGGTLGFKLMTYYQSHDRVIIVDTVSADGAPGTVCRLSAEELMALGTQRQTAHEVEVVEMLEICSLLENMAEVSVVGIVPEDIISVEIDLSDTMKGVFATLIETLIRELERAGVTVTPKPQIRSLEAIIGSYQEPESIVPA
jgi:hydrogenase maturation protease